MALRAASSRLLQAATPRTAAPAMGGGLLDASIRPPTAVSQRRRPAHTSSERRRSTLCRDPTHRNRHGEYLANFPQASPRHRGSWSAAAPSSKSSAEVPSPRAPTVAARDAPRSAPSSLSPVHGTLDVGLSRADAHGYARSLPGAALRRPACCLQASRRWTESGRAVCSLVEDDVHSC